jgi:TDG/mug DNA glycosylase family protein
MLEPLPDLMIPGLKILFTGYNPSILSSKTGHHYAHPNNRFWKVLYLSGLTPRQLPPQEDQTLLAQGYGFTNIVSRPTQSAHDITREEYEEGRILLLEKVSFFRPQVVCFVGKKVYEQYAARHNIEWGFQSQSVVDGVKDFVAPSTSGLVRMRIEAMVSIYKQLQSYFA